MAATVAEDPFGLLGPGAGGSVDSLLEALEAQTLCGATQQPPPSDLARPGDNCAECGVPLKVLGMEYVCSNCNEVREAADFRDVIPVSNPEIPGAASLRGRLRIVGPESGWFQPDMDRTNPGDSSEQQKKATYSELKALNEEYKSRGGNPFPLNVLQDVAHHYNVVQKRDVKRSMMKKTILAAMVYHTCLSRNFSRSQTEATELMCLNNHGIARGNDYLRSVREDSDLVLDLNKDRLWPHIETTFALLGLDGCEYDSLRKAVADVVTIAKKNSIGYQSVLKSKVMATTAEVLRRKGLGTSLQEVAASCKIRIHTIRRFLNMLDDYHSFFVEAYEKHGLDSAPSPRKGG